MGILSLTVDKPAQIGNFIGGVVPRKPAMVTTDSLATITTAGYINPTLVLEAQNLFPTDVLDVIYNFNAQTNSGSYGQFTVGITNGIVTLTEWTNPGNVLLPVVSNDIPIFNGTDGQIKDSGVAFSNLTDTVSPLFHGTATANDFVSVNNTNKTIQDSGSAPSAASQPFVVMSPGGLTSGNIPFLNDANGTLNTGRTPSATTAGYKVVMSPGSITIGNSLKAADANGTLADAGYAANIVALSTITNPDPQSDLFWMDIGCAASQLATAGKVNVLIGSGTKTYYVRDVRLNISTGLSGGGGNRLLQLTDGTTNWLGSGVSAALLGSPTNSEWGVAGFTFPSITFLTTSQPNTNIYFQYTGGTTDYTTGVVFLSVLLQRIT